MIRMKTANDVRRALQRVGNDVLSGKIEPKIANSFCYVASTLLSSIRTDEQERRIAELEERYDEIFAAHENQSG